MLKVPLIRITFRLPEPLIGALKDVAEQEGVTFSEATRRVLRRGLGVVSKQLTGPVAGTRRDRAALLLAQMISICYQVFYDWRVREINLDDSRQQMEQVERLAEIAWIASGYLEELGAGEMLALDG